MMHGQKNIKLYRRMFVLFNTAKTVRLCLLDNKNKHLID
jgi:hypothetical protein